MDIDRAYEREQDELEKRFDCGEITGIEYARYCRDLREDYRLAMYGERGHEEDEWDC